MLFSILHGPSWSPRMPREEMAGKFVNCSVTSQTNKQTRKQTHTVSWYTNSFILIFWSYRSIMLQEICFSCKACEVNVRLRKKISSHNWLNFSWSHFKFSLPSCKDGRVHLPATVTEHFFMTWYVCTWIGSLETAPIKSTNHTWFQSCLRPL